jgi:hypothetical protein
LNRGWRFCRFVKLSILLTVLVLWSRMMAGLPWCLGVICRDFVSSSTSATALAKPPTGPEPTPRCSVSVPPSRVAERPTPRPGCGPLGGERRAVKIARMQAVDRARSVAALVENHRAFLRYLERRTGDRALAEDILQDAFAKVVSRPESAPTDEAIIPWFYRGLRNAAVDQFRRRGASVRAMKRLQRNSRPGRCRPMS